MAIYMKVEGLHGSKDIAGSATDSKYEGWIVVDKFALGGKKDVDDTKKNAAEASQRSTGVASFSKARLSKAMDISSPSLFRWASQLKERTVSIRFAKARGKPFLEIELDGARLDKYESDQKTSKGAGADEYEEDLELFFKGITVVWTTYGEKNKAKDMSAFFFEQPEEKDWLEANGESKDGESKDGAAAVPAAVSLGATVRTPRTEKLPAPQIEKGSRQTDRRLDIVGLDNRFTLASLEGEEAISRPFHFELLLTSENMQVDPVHVVGQKVAFVIEDAPGKETEHPFPPRFFHGYVARFLAGAAIHTHDEEEKRRYTAVVVPWFWFLTKNTNCRVFQEKTIPEIVEEIFKDRGISSDDYRLELHGSYDPLDHCVQFRESDFDFVSRLLEEAGIFYFFEHTESNHVMVLADSTAAYQDCEDTDVVFGGRTARVRQLSEWSHGYQVVGWNALYRDYNFKTPKLTLEVKKPGKGILPKPDIPQADKYELFDYPGRYSEKDGGTQRAKTRIEAEEARFEILQSGGAYDSFTPGGKFTIDEHEVEDEAQSSWLVLAVRHVAQDQSRGDDSLVLYQNTFRAMPSDVVFRPERRTPRPVVGGPQTAVVVGPSKDSDEEIYTDDEGFGCVKVQFHWDRLNEKSELSSCWVRVAQSIAGKEWGYLTLPRVGQEVVVEFLDGDPDRPLITGSVYNNDYKPPYPLPANKTRTVLYKSRSSLKGDATTFNELYFEDKKDEEQVYFHAEKDFDRVVENNDTLKVGASQTVTIERDQTITLNKGDQSLTVAEGRQDIKIETDQTLSLEKGDQTVSIKKGSQNVTIEESQGTTLNKGDRMTAISKGSDTLTVKKDRTASIEGSDVVEVKGDQSVTVKEGDIETKAAKGQIKVEAKKAVEIKVGPNKIKIQESGITIEGKDKIELKVGGTKVKLSSSGVEMKGSKIKLN